MGKWDMVKLSDMFTLQMGKTPSRNKPDYWNGSHKWVSIADIGKATKYISDTKECITDKAVSEIGIKSTPKDTVIMSFKLSIGKTAITAEDVYTNEAIMSFIDNGKYEFDLEYIYHLFSGKDWNEGTNKAVMGITLNKATLSQIKIPLPPLKVQHKMAENLDKATHIIDLCNTILKKLDMLVKSRFVEMFGDIKNIVPLSFYIESLSAGKSLAGEEECENKVLKTGAVTYDYFDNTQVKNLPLDYVPLQEHRVNKGDVIISRMNTTELVGAAAYVWNAPLNTYLPDRLWRANIKENVNPIFIWQILIQQTIKDEIRKIAGGTSGSMKNISKTGLLGIRVIEAPHDLQNQFANFVKQTDKSKLVVKKVLEKAETLKRALMQEYFE